MLTIRDDNDPELVERLRKALARDVASLTTLKRAKAIREQERQRAAVSLPDK